MSKRTKKEQVKVGETKVGKMVNIGSDDDDKHYRYKRSVVALKTESKNGGQTKFLNIGTIVEQLSVLQLTKPEREKRMLEVKTKLILALKKKYGIVKEQDNGTVIVRGNVDLLSVEEIINSFIKKFILCPTCKLPEWTGTDCQACGHNVADKKEKKEKKDGKEKKIDKNSEPESDDDDDEKTEETIDDRVAELIKIVYKFRDDASATSALTVGMEGKVQLLLDRSWDCDNEKAFKLLKRDVLLLTS
jgi:translation initiation factor 5